MTNIGDEGIGLWDEHDGFYYSALNLPDGRVVPLKIRSMVSLIPLFAVETLDAATLARLPRFAGHMDWFLHNRPDLAASCHIGTSQVPANAGCSRSCELTE
jgi:hypothetical protein